MAGSSKRRANDAASSAERRGNDSRGTNFRGVNRVYCGLLHELVVAIDQPKTTADDDSVWVKGEYQCRERKSKLLGCPLHDRVVSFVGEYLLGSFHASCRCQSSPACDSLHWWSSDDDRVAMGTESRFVLYYQAIAHAGPNAEIQEFVEAIACAVDRLGSRRRTHVRINDDSEGRERRRDVEGAPVERVRALGSPVFVDEFTEPDSHRVGAVVSQSLREFNAVSENGSPAAQAVGRLRYFHFDLAAI
jgi:hypothetical protein